MKTISEIPTPGYFEDETLSKTFEAITNCKAWGYLTHFEPDESDKVIEKIGAECIKLGAGHSGDSFAICMRHMQCIAKKGWDEYYISRNK